MKIRILKFLIKKNGYYDPERLVLFANRSFTSIFTCWIYRKFLKTFCGQKYKIKNPKSTLEIIGSLMLPIKNFNKKNEK